MSVTLTQYVPGESIAESCVASVAGVITVWSPEHPVPCGIPNVSRSDCGSGCAFASVRLPSDTRSGTPPAIVNEKICEPAGATVPEKTITFADEPVVGVGVVGSSLLLQPERTASARSAATDAPARVISDG